MSDVHTSILVVDDDTEFLGELAALMRGTYHIETATSGMGALEAATRCSFDAVLLDIDLGQGMDGFEVLEKLRKIDPDLPIIMVTRDASLASAVAALKKGAVDYLDKRPDIHDLGRRITRALEGRRLARENRFLRLEVESLKGEMVGQSLPMRRLREEILLAAQGMNPVLIAGETGTGKELVARAIHRLSCPDAPFVAFNCAAVPKELFESRLFGSERGAYTGAERRLVGLFELAGPGILFLDEITEMEPYLQAKLLRAIDEREFQRLGSAQSIPFAGRLLASSNRDLKKALQEGTLRHDLYFRLSTYVIEVPPLRDRRDDVPCLVEHFLRRKALELKKARPHLGEETIHRLCAYDWPGNVRELENTIEAFVVRGQLLMPGKAQPSEAGESQPDLHELPYTQATKLVLQRFQTKYVTAVLAACRGDVGAAAERIGMTRFGLQKLMKRLGL